MKKNVKKVSAEEKVCDRQQVPKRTISVPKPSTGLNWQKELLSLFPLSKKRFLEFWKIPKNLSYAKIGSSKFYVQLKNLIKSQFWLFFGLRENWLKPDFGLFWLKWGFEQLG